MNVRIVHRTPRDRPRAKPRLRALAPILALGLASAAHGQAATEIEASLPPPDAARRVTGYPTLVGLTGATTSAGLPIVDAAARQEASQHFCTAIAYAAKTDSDSLLVWHRDHLELARDFAPHDARSRSWSASMAKTVVALALGVAIAEGKIASVDTPVAQVLTEWRDSAHRAITFRDLLEMTSGLDHGAPTGGGGAALMGGNDAVANALALAATTPAGQEFDYYTLNVTLLIEAIQRATGEPFARFVSQRLWQPLGAGDAFFAGDGKGHPTPSIYATARDWLRIGVLIKDRGEWQGKRLVPAAWIDAMTTPSPRNSNYGWLVWLGSPPGTARSYGPHVAFAAHHSQPFLAPDMVYLDGFGGERVYIARSADLVIVRTGAMDTDWDDALIPNAIVAAERGASGTCP